MTAAEDFGFRRLFGVSGIRKAAPCMAGESHFLWKIMSDWMEISPDVVSSMPAGFISHYIIYITG